MGLFSRWKERKREEFQTATAPYHEARNEIWNREIARLGQEEFDRRTMAVADAQLGTTGPSGFEDWDRQLQGEIEDRAHQIANARGVSEQQ